MSNRRVRSANDRHVRRRKGKGTVDCDEIVLWFDAFDECEDVLGGQHPQGDEELLYGASMSVGSLGSGTEEAFDGLNQ